jgi:hypothetical protein
MEGGCNKKFDYSSFTGGIRVDASGGSRSGSRIICTSSDAKNVESDEIRN